VLTALKGLQVEVEGVATEVGLKVFQVLEKEATRMLEPPQHRDPMAACDGGAAELRRVRCAEDSPESAAVIMG